MVSIKEHYKEI